MTPFITEGRISSFCLTPSIFALKFLKKSYNGIEARVCALKNSCKKFDNGTEANFCAYLLEYTEARVV